MDLVKYEAARRALMEASSVDEVKTIKDKYQAIRAYAKQSKDWPLMNWASEIRIRAERRMGEMLREQEMNKGGKGEQAPYRSHGATGITPTLAEVGITKSMSSRAQRIASVPEEQFEAVIEEYKDAEKELTSATIQRLVTFTARTEQIKNISEISQSGLKKDIKYRVIYADPPWDYGDKRTGLKGYSSATDHYPDMTIDQLCDLPVKSMAMDDAVLFLWVTSPLLYEAAPIIEAWGFKYKASYIWDKVKHNVGHYNSVRHELLLICTRGSCTPDDNKLHDSVIEIERTRHSEKPEYFRHQIDRMYQHGNKLELFRRGDAPEGWDVWGNQVYAA